MRKGFTLVEVLIGVVILALVIGAVSAIEVSHIKTSSQGKSQLEALSLAQEGLNISKLAQDNYTLCLKQHASDSDPAASCVAKKIDKPAAGVTKYYRFDATANNLVEIATSPGGVCGAEKGEIVPITVGATTRSYCRVIAITGS